MAKSERIWVDDVRPLPPGYSVWYQSVREVLDYVTIVLFADENHSPKKILLDLDHDAGDYQKDGGDFIRILNYFEENDFVASHPETEFIFRIHSANPALGGRTWRELSNATAGTSNYRPFIKT